MTLRNLRNKLERYFMFSTQELASLVITIIGLAFITSWSQWGAQTFDARTGFANLGIALIFVTITLLVHHSAQRIVALVYGFKPEHKLWWHGLLIGLIIAILSHGSIQFLGASALSLHMMPVHRLGKFRYGPNLAHIARVHFSGPFANILFAGFVKSIEWLDILSPTIAQPLFILNLWFAATNLLPLPPLDGSHMLYKSRLTYVLIITSLIAYVTLISLFDLYSYILAFIVGLVCTIIFYLTIESK